MKLRNFNGTRGKFFNKILKMFSISMLPVLISSILACYIVRNSVVNEITYINGNIFNSLVNNIERTYKEIEKESLLIASEASTSDFAKRKISYESLITDYYKDMTKLQNQILYLVHARDYIESITLNLNANSMVIAHDGFYDMDEYYSKFNIFDSYGVEYWRSITDQYADSYIIGTTRISRYSFDMEGNRHSLKVVPLVIPYKSFKNIPLSLVINVREEYLTRLLSDSRLSQGSAFVILDQMGKIITHIESPEIDGNEMIKKIESMEIDFSKMNSLKVEGEKFIVYGKKFKDMDWTLYSLIPHGEYFDKLRLVMKMLILINVFILAGGLMAAYFFSKRLYSPIGNLIKMLYANEDMQKGSDEIEYLTNRLNFMQRAKVNMDEKIRDYSKMKEIAKESIIRNLVLFGENLTDKNDIFALFQEETVKLDKQYYLLLVFKVFFSASFAEDFSEKEQVMIRAGAKKIIRETMLIKMEDSIFTEIEEGVFILLANSNDKTIKEDFCEALLNLHEVFKEDAKYFRMYVYCGELLSDLFLLSAEYSRAVNQMEYIDLYRREPLLEKLDVVYKEIYLPENLEERMINAITNGDDEIVTNLIDEIVTRNFMSSFLLWRIRKISEALYNIRLTVIQANNLDIESSKEDRNYPLIDFEADRLKARFVKMFHELNRVYHEQVVESNRKGILKSYIDEHFMDCNIYIESMAQDLGFNPSYLSRMFKQIMGKSFSEYIFVLRMEKAKELLMTTDLKVDEIALKVGISNRSTFNRLFKNHTSIPPAIYRTRYKQN